MTENARVWAESEYRDAIEAEVLTSIAARVERFLSTPEGFAYHAPGCEVTAEDNCTCDIRRLLEEIENCAA